MVKFRNVHGARSGAESLSKSGHEGIFREQNIDEAGVGHGMSRDMSKLSPGLKKTIGAIHRKSKGDREKFIKDVSGQTGLSPQGVTKMMAASGLGKRLKFNEEFLDEGLKKMKAITDAAKKAGVDVGKKSVKAHIEFIAYDIDETGAKLKARLTKEIQFMKGLK